MNAVPTTKISVLRGEGETLFGDSEDSDTTIATGVLASLLTVSRKTRSPVDGRPEIITYFTARVPHGTDVQLGDRVKDEISGSVYILTLVDHVQNPVARQDVRLELHRVA
jgi:hypothetical protein